MVGGFPSGTIFGEDATVTGRMLLARLGPGPMSPTPRGSSFDCYGLGEEFRRVLRRRRECTPAPLAAGALRQGRGREGNASVQSELRHLARQGVTADGDPVGHPRAQRDQAGRASPRPARGADPAPAEAPDQPEPALLGLTGAGRRHRTDVA